MSENSIGFFGRQFRRQIADGEFALNPFEQAALPYLAGDVLELGCGIGNLALAAARRGCRVTALDAAESAIEHLRAVAVHERLAVDAGVADLGRYRIETDHDAIVTIGLLMFFDCDSARATLEDIRRHVRPGGVAAINVLVEGTTWLEAFGDGPRCLFPAGELRDRFADWEVLLDRQEQFSAPGQTVKCFSTLIARRPLSAGSKA